MNIKSILSLNFQKYEYYFTIFNYCVNMYMQGREQMASYYLIDDYEILQDIARKIKKKRISLNYSQAYIAKKTGLSMHTISNVETGKAYTMDSFIKVMRILGMIDNLDKVVSDVVIDPETVKKQKTRQRVKEKADSNNTEWKWGN